MSWAEPGGSLGFKFPWVLAFVNLHSAGDGKDSLCQVTGARPRKSSLSNYYRIGTCYLPAWHSFFLRKGHSQLASVTAGQWEQQIESDPSWLQTSVASFLCQVTLCKCWHWVKAFTTESSGRPACSDFELQGNGLWAGQVFGERVLGKHHPFRWGPKGGISNKFPRDADADGPSTIPWEPLTHSICG